MIHRILLYSEVQGHSSWSWGKGAKTPEAKNGLALDTNTVSGWHGTAVERRSLAGELSLSNARPSADW